MSDKIIPNVPRVAMFIGEQALLTPFVGSLYAALSGMGENWSYADVLGLSGAGNRLRWMPGIWDPGNVDILNMDEPALTPLLRALKAVGWKGEFRQSKPLSGLARPYVDAETARLEIKDSLDRDIPVLAFGILGPPECCVVFGYENDGESLCGWNYFQTDEGFAAEQPFVKAGWYDKMWGYLLLTEKLDCPSQRESAMEVLHAVVRHAYQGEVRGAKVGFAAWDAMLEQLEQDDFSACSLKFPDGMPGEDSTWQNSVQGRFMVYCDALCQIYERNIVLPYYEKLADALPEWASELRPAIEVWRVCGAYGGFLWGYLTMDDSGLEKFRTPEIRKILTDEGWRSKAKDIEAVGHIEKLLSAFPE